MERTLDERELCDLECLSNGSFDPLTSYMTQTQYVHCLDTKTLDGRAIFPIPITLSLPVAVPSGTEVLLKSKTGVHVATLTVTATWVPDLEAEWQNIFGTTDDNHPYIKYMKGKQIGVYVSGDLVMKPYGFHDTFLEYRKTPAELKAIGKWVGFQTRNPLHRSHIELIQSAQTTVVPSTPVLLHPVEGVTQECDVPFPVRMACYKKVLPYLGDATLSILSLSMRMAGPREAVWHAVIRRNYGCSHFIVGRDHAGPSYKKKDGSSFYDPFEAQRLAKSLEEQIGITILTSEEVVYCEDVKQMMTTSAARTGSHTPKTISGTKFREMLEKDEDIPLWYSYPEVVKPLRDYYRKPKGLCLYFVGLSGAGKSTIAQRIKAKMQEDIPHKEITLLDADDIRTHLSKGLGFSRADRSTNVRRIGFVASEIVKHGGIVLVANIAPYEEDRAYNRALISANGTYIEIFVDTDIEECARRDVKGLYAAARAGTLANFTGVSDPFEIPTSDIVLQGGTINEQVSVVTEFLDREGAK
jgi:sulfate adenylyltransferase